MPTVKLTTQKFKEDIFDYTAEKEWNYKGDKPAIIDFYAIGVAHARWSLQFLKN